MSVGQVLCGQCPLRLLVKVEPAVYLGGGSVRNLRSSERLTDELDWKQDPSVPVKSSKQGLVAANLLEPLTHCALFLGLACHGLSSLDSSHMLLPPFMDGSLELLSESGFRPGQGQKEPLRPVSGTFSSFSYSVSLSPFSGRL